MSHHHNMTVALKENQFIHIDEVESGRACNCICPACNEPLIAKKGNKMVWHFCHESGSECAYGYQTSLHLMAKEIFTKLKKIKLPATFCLLGKVSDPIEVEIEDVYLEKSEGDFIPDIVIVVNGVKIFVEIYVTHKVDAIKKAKIAISNTSTIELDLSNIDRDITEDILTSYIKQIGSVYDFCNTKWIYNKRINEINQVILDRVVVRKAIADGTINCPINKRLSKKGNYFASIHKDCDFCKFNLSCSFNFYKKNYFEVLEDQQNILAELKLNQKFDLLNKYKEIMLKFPDILSYYASCICLGEVLLAEVDDLYLDGNTLYEKYKKEFNHYQKSLLQGECPSCGAYLREKTNTHTGEIFYGCPNYYESGCKFSMNWDTYWEKIDSFKDIWDVRKHNRLKR